MLQLALQIVILVGIVILVALLARRQDGSRALTSHTLPESGELGTLRGTTEAMRQHQLTEEAPRRADAARVGSVTQFQFEAELRVFEELWANLVDVQASAESLRPGGEPVQLRDESIREARDRKRLADFAVVFNGFTRLVQQRRPFFPPTVYHELQQLMQLAHGEAIELAHMREHQNPDYWYAARENAEALSGQVDRICEVLRDRMRLTGSA